MTMVAKDAEYRLQITPYINERTSRTSTLVTLSTIKSFASFRYALDVDAEFDGDTLRLCVLGLKTPDPDLPAAGPAEFKQDYEEMSGDCRIVVKGLDGSSTAIAVRVTPQSVTLMGPVTGGNVALDLHPPHRSP
jgi:hypothetical protein